MILNFIEARDAATLSRFMSTAKPGEWARYHRGTSIVGCDENVKRAVMVAAGAGRAHPVQQTHLLSGVSNRPFDYLVTPASRRNRCD